MAHGFLRAPNGAFTTFDPKGSTDTLPAGFSGLSSFGKVTGSYIDSTGVAHGFLRLSKRTITPFDPKGSTGTFRH
jgi:hypothetical protein